MSKTIHDNSSTASTREVLIAARKLIEQPQDWGTLNEVSSYGPRYCAAFAILRAQGEYFTRSSAMNAFRSAVGLEKDVGYIGEWNDDPVRTHAEVLAAFDKALAEAVEETRELEADGSHRGSPESEVTQKMLRGTK